MFIERTLRAFLSGITPHLLTSLTFNSKGRRTQFRFREILYEDFLKNSAQNKSLSQRRVREP